MSEPLHMLRMALDRPHLATWAAAHGLLGRDGDLGYALHAALIAAFGELAPKPFRLFEGRPHARGAAASNDPLLYAYSHQPDAALLDHARAFADPEVWQMLDLDRLRVKPMPACFEVGARLGFEVRVRPVRRRDRPDGRCERDVFLIACDRVDAKTPVDRAAIYGHWLSEHLAEGGARLAGGEPAACHLDAFHRSRVARRDASRRLRWIEGPDAVLSGVLDVTEPDRFSALLARGVGRHRAFGFGMLLLRPPGPG